MNALALNLATFGTPASITGPSRVFAVAARETVLTGIYWKLCSAGNSAVYAAGAPFL